MGLKTTLVRISHSIFKLSNCKVGITDVLVRFYVRQQQAGS